MRGSLLSSALLLLWPGLGCTRGRVSAFIPAIYLHLGPIAGGPVALTIDGAGLMMTKKRPFFYYLSFGPPSIPWSWLPSSGLPPWLRVRRQKGPFSYSPRFGDAYPKSVFLGGRSVVGPLHPLSPVPYPLSLHPSPVKSISNKKRDLLGPFFVVLVACFYAVVPSVRSLRALAFW